MPSILTSIQYPTDDIRQQLSSVRAYLEDQYLGQGSLCIAESQLVWSASTSGDSHEGVSIDYPNLTMHGIVTHDPKYTEEHLVVVAQRPKVEDDDENDSSDNNNDDSDGDRNRSPVEYDAIETVNYRFVMMSNEDLKLAYQAIAECQALHPDPTDDMGDEDEIGSDIDYGNEDENDANGNYDPYGYHEHFASMNRPIRRPGPNSNGNGDAHVNDEDPNLDEETENTGDDGHMD